MSDSSESSPEKKASQGAWWKKNLKVLEDEPIDGEIKDDTVILVTQTHTPRIRISIIARRHRIQCLLLFSADAEVAERSFPEALPPSQLVCNLLPFQRESLFWMINQEHSFFRGGILADEMGLGWVYCMMKALLC